jgi:hypothetical protein
VEVNGGDAYNRLGMTRITRFVSFVLIVLTSSVVLAQGRGGQRQSQTDFQKMLDMGRAHKTAGGLYQALKTAARGGKTSPSFSDLPDWSGLWTTAGGGTFFGPGPAGIMPKLTPAAAAAVKKGEELEKQGISYDENLSECGPPGFPRWLVIPFLREFIVRPEQTWLSSETVNNVRRIYTDGRSHPPEDERYPLYYGDSIGFWDGPKLVIHTTQLMARSMGRNQPDQSEKMETVEIWQKVDGSTIEADAWIYDPTLYVEPWYLKRRYAQVSNPDKSLRMNYWHCGENPNNDVIKTPDGSTQFKDFIFGGEKDRAKEQSR